MCRAVRYLFGNSERCVSFADAAARLPVMTRSGGARLVTWGRRRLEEGALPAGGWARIGTVTAGAWDRWFPRPVRVPVLGFSEPDRKGRERAYELVRGQCLQGLLARDTDRSLRVYIVMIEPDGEDPLHSRWPRVIRIGAGDVASGWRAGAVPAA